MTVTETTLSSPPSVVVVGGGPGGLLAAILLGRRNVSTTVLEKAAEPDEWSTKSYSMVIGARGQAALKKAGAMESARNKGMARRCNIFYDTNGNSKVISKEYEDSLGFSRPLLAECLEEITSHQPTVTIRRGFGVTGVARANDGMLEVALDDGSCVRATHVIGADGKWSVVRASFPELDSQATIRTEPSFGVHMMAPSVPAGWRTDGTNVIKPSEECMFYIIAAPIPTGELSISMVCYDETLERYPWLAPPGDMTLYGNGGWEDEYSAMPKTAGSNVDLAEKLANLFETELPFFLAAVGRETLETARINRRTSWLEMTSKKEGVSYATGDGLVALIGDAAHAVTPTMGEGCNMAMESAVALIDSLSATPTVDDMTAAFIGYGTSRPKDTQPIQQRSAESSRFKKVY
jgi:kynurenine 3-monooxygenase